MTERLYNFLLYLAALASLGSIVAIWVAVYLHFN